MDLQQHLYKFLILYRRLCIPHVGSFMVENATARLDTGSSLLFAPKPVIRFYENNQPPSDKLFFNFLADEMVMDKMSVIKEFHDFSFTVRYDLELHKIFSFTGIGKLTKQSDQSLLFTPETGLVDILPPVAWPGSIPDTYKNDIHNSNDAVVPEQSELTGMEEPYDTEETEETTIVAKDRWWWVYALILLSAGIIALLFYYLQPASYF